jgi:hypothetical protein
MSRYPVDPDIVVTRVRGAPLEWEIGGGSSFCASLSSGELNTEATASKIAPNTHTVRSLSAAAKTQSAVKDTCVWDSSLRSVLPIQACYLRPEANGAIELKEYSLVC